MTTARRVTFEVFGIPKAKGNAKSFVVQRPGQKPRAITTLDNARSKNWQTVVADCAQTAASGMLFVGAVVLTISFVLPRPLKPMSSHHVTLPDIDKLLRAILDALTGTVYVDDKQVVELHARKVYQVHRAAPPGVFIVIEDAALPDPLQPQLPDCRSLFHG